MIERVFVLALLIACFRVSIENGLQAEEATDQPQPSVEKASRPNHAHTMELLLDDLLPLPLYPYLSTNDTPMSNITDACKSIMHHFAHAGGNFTKCLLDHARPFRMCEKCLAPYTRFTRMYDDLQDDTHCSQYLLLADRVQVVTSTYRSFQSTWADSFCDKCYEDGSIQVNSSTGQVSFNFTAEMVLLQGMQSNVTDCFRNNANIIPLNETAANGSAVCTVCRDVYQQMNNKYLELKDKNGGHMCMDLVDMMNYTRLMWSSRFRCSRPMPSPVSVIVICVVAALAVFVFYVSRPFTASIRTPHIFKAKRLGATHTGYGTLREEMDDRSLPQVTNSPTHSPSTRRRGDSQRPLDGNGLPRPATGTS